VQTKGVLSEEQKAQICAPIELDNRALDAQILEQEKEAA